MSGIAFLFPGQASQKVGMGQDIYENDIRVRELYDAAESYLKFPLKQLSFEGPLEELTKTQYTQPAIFVHSCAIDLLLKEKKVSPIAAAGHSLGEFSAYVSAEAINFEEGLKLVKLRGELMGKAGNINPGAMTAIIGLESELVEEACQEAGGIVIPANYNSPGQLVISGEIDAVQRAGEIAKHKGAKIVKPLTVSGAFHSPLMENASEELYSALDEIKFKSPKFPVFTNVTARPAENPEEARELLKRQLLNPVRWENTIRNMLEYTGKFIEAGPGNVLSGLLKRIDKEAVAIPVGSFEALSSFE
jgi:[acyl-carrier-protein] S-malonyltransferase